jgi:uracil-DNA glycosylase
VSAEPEPFAATAGPRDARVVFIGEAHGETEERLGGIPFAGASGREFARMLIEAGWDEGGLLAAAVAEREDRLWLARREDWLAAASVLLTNVFALRPIGNNLAHLCASKDALPRDYALPPMRTENPRYVKPDYLPHLRRLNVEVSQSPRSLVICLGGPALWSLTGSSAIGQMRGAVGSAQRGPSGLAGMKYLATYHPAAVLRAWHWRTIVLADLFKARREREFPEVRRPARSVVVNPSIEEVEAWTSETLAGAAAGHFTLLSPDIETMNGQIRCIGFARARDEALVVPFISEASGASYWPSEDEELRAWSAVARLLDSPIPKVFQNGLFDMQYLTRCGLRVRAAAHDTMLLHHVLYPELQKGLGFLGSVYCNEAPWKLMRAHRGEKELKRDE